MPTLKEMMMKEARRLFKDFFEEQGSELINNPDPVSQQLGLTFLKQANKIESQMLSEEPVHKPRGEKELEFPSDVKDDLYVEHIAVRLKTNREDAVREVYEILQKEGWEKVTEERFTPDFGKMTKDGSLLKFKTDTVMVYGNSTMIKEIGKILENANSKNFEVEGYYKPVNIEKVTEQELTDSYNKHRVEIEKFMLDSLKKHPMGDAYLIDDTKKEFYPEPHSVDVERGFRGKPYHFNEFAMNLIESMKKRNLIEERKNRLVFKPKTIVMGNEGKARELTNMKGM